MSDDLDLSCTNFNDTFLRIINSRVPSRSVRLHSLPPWLPRPLLAKIKQRRSLFRQAKATNSVHLYTQYRSLHNLISAKIKRSKSTFINSLSQSPTSFWSYVRSLRHNKDPTPPLKSPLDGKLATSNSAKAGLLNEAFSYFFTMDPTPPIIPPLNSSLKSNESFLCSPDSIVNLISSLPNRTSSGPDDISSLLLKSTAYSIVVPLQHIFNLSISTGSFPSIWKRSTVIPIPKTVPPLSLVSKLLEDTFLIFCLTIFIPMDHSPMHSLDFFPTNLPLQLCCQRLNTSSPPLMEVSLCVGFSLMSKRL